MGMALIYLITSLYGICEARKKGSELKGRDVY